MRVIFVDMSGRFGPLNSIVPLLSPLASLGCEPMLVVPGTVKLELERESIDAETISVGERHSLERDLATARVLRQFRRQPNTIIHANTTSAARGAALGSLSGRLPLVVHLRNSSLSSRERVLLRLLRGSPIRAALVAVSSGAVDAAGLSGDLSVPIVRDPVEALPVRPEGPPSAPMKVGIVVNQQPTKGFDVFVDAAIHSRDLDIRWEVFGSAGIEPPANPYVRQGRERLTAAGLDDRVHFHGIVPGLGDAYQHLDAVLVTSRRESSSRVAVEAMLGSVPLIAPDIPGLRDTVDDGRYCTLYDVGEGRDAARALHEVMVGYDDAWRVCLDARGYARATFEPSSIAAELATLYRLVLERS